MSGLQLEKYSWWWSLPRAWLTVCLAVLSGPAVADDRSAIPAGDQASVSDADAQTENRWATPRYPGVRVLIDAAGNVFVDDEPATPELLREAFSGVKRFNGVLWYARENPATEPEGKVAEAVDEVIGILSDYRLAVELFEGGFPDPDEHWQTLENPPPRYLAPSGSSSASAGSEEGER